LKGFINEFVFFIKSKSLGCVEDICNVTLSSIVAVKIEHVKEVFTMLSREDGIFSNDFFGKYGLSFFFCKLFSVDDHSCYLSSVWVNSFEVF